jgi:lipopolysaccharide/colanic/teichoic acid biosynthesis glycosyltransferase
MVKSGMTGWAQIHGLRGNTSIQKRVEYDLYYIEHWSLLLDLKILARTWRLVVRGQGIYKGERGGWHPPSTT